MSKAFNFLLDCIIVCIIVKLCDFFMDVSDNTRYFLVVTALFLYDNVTILLSYNDIIAVLSYNGIIAVLSYDGTLSEDDTSGSSNDFFFNEQNILKNDSIKLQIL